MFGLGSAKFEVVGYVLTSNCLLFSEANLVVVVFSFRVTPIFTVKVKIRLRFLFLVFANGDY